MTVPESQQGKEVESWQGQVEELRGLVSERAMTGETLLLNMGPHHPSTHGVLRLLLELDGEEIVTCLPDVGYLHTGIEKTIESKQYEKGVTLTDRIDYLAPMNNNVVFVMAIEKMLALDVPERAQVIRVICLELTRIQSHLVWLGTHALDMGAMSAFLYCFRERELILDMFEMLSGQRMMGSYFRPGGLWRDLPDEFLPALQHFVDIFPRRVDDYECRAREEHVVRGDAEDKRGRPADQRPERGDHNHGDGRAIRRREQEANGEDARRTRHAEGRHCRVGVAGDEIQRGIGERI
jgi:NADH:ubiquinone oxidoreductase subunit D